MNEDNKIFKTNEFSIEISPVGEAIQAKDIQYFSYDENSGLQLIHILMDGKPLDLPNGTEIRLSAVKLNNQNQKLIYTPEIVDPLKGIVSFVIPREFLGYQGQIRCGLYINFSNNQTMHVGYFYINMGVSDIDTNLTEFTEDFWQGWSEFEAGSTAKMQELEQRIDEQTEIFNNADVYNKAEIEDKLEPFALRTDIDTLETALVAVSSDANKFRTDITLLESKKAEKEYVDHLIKQAASGSPRGISSLNELKSKYPNGTEGIYVAADTGNWYYWSGTAWTVGSTYEGKMISVKSVQTDKLANLVIGKNLFNKDVLESGYLDRSNGVVIPNMDNVTAGFRYIDSSKGYLTFSKIANGSLNVCFYDSNYKFIPGSGIQITPDAVHTISINPEAVFVRFSLNKLDVEKMQLEYGQTQSEFEAFYQYDPDQKKIGEDDPPKIESPEQIENAIISTEKLANLVTGKNLFNKATTATGYLERSDGTVVPNSFNQTSDFILVEASSEYVLSPKIIHGTVNLVKYDRNKQLLSSQQILPTSADQVIKTDENEVYIRFSINNLHVDETQLEKGQEATEFEAYYKYNPDLVMPVAKGADNVANKLLVSKPSDGNTAFQIYCPAGAENTYFEYGIGYESNPYTDGGTYQNAELWRIISGKMVELNTQTGSVIKSDQVVNAGAWECAIEIDGLPDFHGTYHGYEKMDAIDMYTNNVKADINGVFNVWVDTFKIIYRSKLIKQGTEADYIADVLRIYEWGPDGLKLTQRYNWLQSFDRIKNAYLTMLPILRRASYQDPTSVLITDRAYTDFDFIEYDVSGTNFQPGINAQIDNINQAVIYGTQSKISADVTVSYKNEQVKNMFNISNAEQYNKFYYSYCTGQAVNIGDKWEVESIFKFKKV